MLPTKRSEKKPQTRRFPKPGIVQILTFLSILITAVAWILSLLCMYAGHRPGVLEKYAIFTLNTTRIGEPLLDTIDGEVQNLTTKVNDFLAKRDLKQSRAFPTIIPDAVSSHAAQLTAAAASHISAASSEVQSAKSAGASVVASAGSTMESKVMEVIDDAYRGAVQQLHLQGFYSIYPMATCEGRYQYPNGTNVTASDDPMVPSKRHTSKCSRHSDINLVEVSKILYVMAIALVGMALLLAIVGLVTFRSHWPAMANVVTNALALIILALASTATHGVAVGAEHLVNKFGKEFGISAKAGGSFIALTWTDTILVFVNLVMWVVIFLFSLRRE
ncbi:hypothetical protein K470DRAFT_259148 [Piedraia hortae CBS 480.64]|uniref:Integral membrane protein-like protein n=1 Tax=Piedraia hortae CBS 480.64 TaxID=1314780 RepID=A0A6A7BVK8_9PEZI|nr:hypothetical protein K470DRAFT_259148 [Piedraia hortae CBS 480.64]